MTVCLCTVHILRRKSCHTTVAIEREIKSVYKHVYVSYLKVINHFKHTLYVVMVNELKPTNTFVKLSEQSRVDK